MVLLLISMNFHCQLYNFTMLRPLFKGLLFYTIVQGICCSKDTSPCQREHLSKETFVYDKGDGVIRF